MKEENLSIDEVTIEDGIIVISWSSERGFGRYQITGNGNKFIIDDECMEKPDNREFGKQLMSAWLDTIKGDPNDDYYWEKWYLETQKQK